MPAHDEESEKTLGRRKRQESEIPRKKRKLSVLPEEKSENVEKIEKVVDYNSGSGSDIELKALSETSEIEESDSDDSDSDETEEEEEWVCGYDGCARASNSSLISSKTLEGARLCGACYVYERRYGGLIPRNQRKHGRKKVKSKPPIQKKRGRPPKLRKHTICQYEGCKQISSTYVLRPSKTLPGTLLCDACRQFERKNGKLKPRTERLKGRGRKPKFLKLMTSEEPKKDFPNCPEKHGLTKMKNPSENCDCDICHDSIPKEELMNSCRLCNYDVCFNCFSGKPITNLEKFMCQYEGCKQVSSSNLIASKSIKGIRLCAACYKYEHKRGKLVPREERGRNAGKNAKLKPKPEPLSRKNSAIICEYQGCGQTSNRMVIKSRTLKNTRLCNACYQYEVRHGKLVPKHQRTKGRNPKPAAKAKSSSSSKSYSYTCQYSGCKRPAKALSRSKTLEGVKLCHACYNYETRHGKLTPRDKRQNRGRWQRSLKDQLICEYSGCLRVSKYPLVKSKTLDGVKLCQACVKYERVHGKLRPKEKRIKGRRRKQKKAKKEEKKKKSKNSKYGNRGYWGVRQVGNKFIGSITEKGGSKISESVVEARNEEECAKLLKEKAQVLKQKYKFRKNFYGVSRKLVNKSGKSRLQQTTLRVVPEAQSSPNKTDLFESSGEETQPEDLSGISTPEEKNTAPLSQISTQPLQLDDIDFDFVDTDLQLEKEKNKKNLELNIKREITLSDTGSENEKLKHPERLPNEFVEGTDMLEQNNPADLQEAFSLHDDFQNTSGENFSWVTQNHLREIQVKLEEDVRPVLINSQMEPDADKPISNKLFEDLQAIADPRMYSKFKNLIDHNIINEQCAMQQIITRHEYREGKADMSWFLEQLAKEQPIAKTVLELWEAGRLSVAKTREIYDGLNKLRSSVIICD